MALAFIFKDGYLLTNFHVVDEAEEITVSLNDRREFSAEVVGIDPLSDLAVLKIKGKNLPKVSIGDSEKPQGWRLGCCNWLSFFL
jgi:serine protease Do